MEQAPKASIRNRRLLALLVFLIAFVGAAWLLWPESATPPAAPPVADSPSCGHASPATKGDPAENPTQVPATAPQNAGDVTAAESDEGPHRHALRFETFDRTPASSISVTLSAIDEPDERSTHTTDGAGEIHVRAQVGRMYSIVLGEGWRFLAYPGISEKERPAQGRTWSPQKESAHTRFVVQRDNRITLDVTYADGVPYAGAVSVSSLTIGPGGQLQSGPGSIDALRFELDDNGRAQALPRWDARGPFRITALSGRPGFGDVDYTGTLGDDPQEIRIELPRAATRGGSIVIELLQFGDAGAVNIGIRPAEERPFPTAEELSDLQLLALIERQLGQLGFSGEEYASPLMLPGRYHVSVRQESLNQAEVLRWDEPPCGLVWHGEVEVREGEVTRVRAVPVKSAAVRAKLEFSDSAKVSKAGLGVRTYAGGRYWSDDVKPGTCSVSFGVAREDGVALLYGLDPARQTIFAEAQGYEPREVPVVLRSGEVVDLGTIVLYPAGGSVTINIERPDGVEDAEYKLKILRRGSASIMPPVSFRGNKFTLKGIALGKGLRLVLILRTVEDDLIADDAQYIDLDEANPTGEVTFKMLERQKK